MAEGPQPPFNEGIRTMKSDSEIALQKEKSSFLTFVQQNKEGGYSMKVEQSRSSAPRGSIMKKILVGFLIAIIGAGGGLYALYIVQNRPEEVPQNQKPQPPRPFLGVERTQSIETIDNDRAGLLEAIRTASRVDTYAYAPIYLTKLASTPELVTPETLFQTLRITPPAGLLDQFTGKWNLYLYGQDSYVFLFQLKPNTKSKAQGYLFQWEEKMVQDFGPLIPTLEPGVYVFGDAIVKNIDERIVQVSQSQGTTFGYSFPLNKYLLIATTREGLDRTIERMVAEQIFE